jgi:outer membrane scaffolding protein for murein synthesis (MipA/OmpV family)
MGVVLCASTIVATPSFAQQSWFAGDWSLTLGVAAISMPEFEGDDRYKVFAQPIISFGRQGTERRFSSRNDNVSIGLIDTGTFRAGPTGKLVFARDGGDSGDLAGLDPIRFGAEIGGFAEVYPTDWLRLRGEVRHGIRSHDGVVADISADAFMNVTPTVQVSAGPRVSMASSDYFEAYYGVSAAESVASGLSPYTPDGGFRSVGVGAAIRWDVTDKIETSLFGEYSRLVGPAADSSLVRERGDENQFLIGVSATYRFDFSL